MPRSSWNFPAGDGGPQWGGLQDVRRMPRDEAERKAYVGRQNAIRNVDPFMYDAELESSEGTASGSIGGDFTANLPKRIQGVPHEEKWDTEKYGDQAGAHARAAELRRTIDEIDTKAESMRPGELSNTQFAEAGPSQMVIVDANRAKFEKMKRESEEMARKQHEDKYGLSPQFGGGGFAGVGRL